MTKNTLIQAHFANVQEAMTFAEEHEGRLLENNDGSWTVLFYHMQGDELCPPPASH